MTPIQAYCLYSSIHAHFTTKYDYFKYGGKMKIKWETLEKYGNTHPFIKLSKHNNPLRLIVVNHAYRDIKWVGDLFDEEADLLYTRYNKYNSAVTYHYKQELAKALTDTTFDSLLRPVNGEHPQLLVMLMRKQVSPETVLIIDSLVSFLPWWQKLIADTLMWPKINTKLLKYKPFLSFDTEKLREITRQVCLNTMQE